MKDKRVEYIDVLRGVTMILLFPRLLDKILPLDIKKYFFCSRLIEFFVPLTTLKIGCTSEKSKNIWFFIRFALPLQLEKIT